MASELVDLVKVEAASAGMGPLVLGAALPMYRGISALTDGAQYSYSIQQAPANFEYGTGVWTASTTTLTRNVLKSSNANAPIALLMRTGIGIVALAEDIAASIDTATQSTGPDDAGKIAELNDGGLLDPSLLAPMGYQNTPALVIAPNPDQAPITSPQTNGDRMVQLIGLSGSVGIKSLSFSDDNKGLADVVGKSRGTTVDSYSPMLAGDTIYRQYALGSSNTQFAHIGNTAWRVCGNLLNTTNSELPGAYEIVTCTGNYGPAFPSNNRLAFRLDCFQQAFIAGPRSSAPLLSTYTDGMFHMGANLVIGVGGPEVGAAPFKLTLAGAVLTTVPEAGAMEVDDAGNLYWTKANGTRYAISMTPA